MLWPWLNYYVVVLNNSHKGVEDVTTAMSSKMLLKKHNLFFSKTFAKSLMHYI